MDSFTNLITRMWEKFQHIFTHMWGWVSLALITLFNYFQSALYIYYSILAIIIIDAVLGIIVSKKKGTFILPYLGRETSWKILFYTLLFFAIHIFETTFGSEMNIGLLLAFSVAGIFELISILANGLIIKPDFALFKALLKYLKGEVARKLRISENDVEECLLNKQIEDKKEHN